MRLFASIILALIVGGVAVHILVNALTAATNAFNTVG